MDLPEGFLHIPDPISGSPLKGYQVVRLASDGFYYHSWYTFNVERKYPALPLRGRGTLPRTLEDIPRNWAIDDIGQCWLNNGNCHPYPLVPVDEMLLLSYHDRDGEISRLLGKKPPLPQWMKTALEEGWSPPNGWNEDDYRRE